MSTKIFFITGNIQFEIQQALPNLQKQTKVQCPPNVHPMFNEFLLPLLSPKVAHCSFILVSYEEWWWKKQVHPYDMHRFVRLSKYSSKGQCTYLPQCPPPWAISTDHLLSLTLQSTWAISTVHLLSLSDPAIYLSYKYCPPSLSVPAIYMSYKYCPPSLSVPAIYLSYK